MASLLKNLLAVQPVKELEDTGHGERLKRVLGSRELTAIGLGATIGTGIFVLTGQVAAQHAGPALTISLLIAAIGCAFAALCYAELAAMLPVSGSAYSYAYASLGEAIAWFIGWNLSLEYLMSASAVAVSWSGYVVNILADLGIHLPDVLVNAPLARGPQGGLVVTHAIINVPAILIVAMLGWVCYVGVRQSAALNTIMVAIKVSVIVLFIIMGLSFIDTHNWTPYLPPNTGQFGHFGISGVLQGAAIIFFSYVGFDTASTTALEARNPQRDVPIGIIASLVISTVLYIAMGAVMTGMVPYGKLDVDAPVAVALDVHPQLHWMGMIVKVGAVIGMTSIVLMSLLGQPRILLAMADDGLLPAALKKVHPKYRTPHVATIITVVIAAAIAGVFPLDVLGELISIGILLAFGVVCIGVLVLRFNQPTVVRPFRVPAAAIFCPVGALLCFGLTLWLPVDTWWRLAIWSVLGGSIYALYGYRNSRLRARS